MHCELTCRSDIPFIASQSKCRPFLPGTAALRSAALGDVCPERSRMVGSCSCTGKSCDVLLSLYSHQVDRLRQSPQRQVMKLTWSVLVRRLSKPPHDRSPQVSELLSFAWFWLNLPC